MSRSARFCDGVARRDFLRLGTAGVFGLGLTLPDLLAAGPRRRGRQTDERCLAHLSFPARRHEPHGLVGPQAGRPGRVPRRFRTHRHERPWRPHQRTPAAHGEQTDKIALIRSFRHHNSDHGPADHYILTGYFPTAGFNPTPRPPTTSARPTAPSSPAPSARGSVPPYVCLPKLHPSAGSAYLGPTAAPFVIDADPNAPDFAVPDLAPPAVVDASPARRPPGAAGRSTASRRPPRPRQPPTPRPSASSSRRRSS